MNDPEAPIAHHWLDSTHVAFGVVTAGVVYDRFKLEGSLFNGREPDQHRWDFDPLRLNSGSGRVTWNPTDDLSFQASYGYLKSPEQLEPGVDQHRITASATYNKKLENGNWQTTFAWGQNIIEGEHPNALLLESAFSWYGHTIFGRAENVDKNELFLPGDPLHGRSFNVSKFSLGYVYDFPVADHLTLGLGAVGSLFALPSGLNPAYGSSPTACSVFVRARVV
jgi:hypothetical protein